jgi:hypothetical protein
MNAITTMGISRKSLSCIAFLVAAIPFLIVLWAPLRIDPEKQAFLDAYRRDGILRRTTRDELISILRSSNLYKQFSVSQIYTKSWIMDVTGEVKAKADLDGIEPYVKSRFTHSHDCYLKWKIFVAEEQKSYMFEGNEFKPSTNQIQILDK